MAGSDGDGGGEGRQVSDQTPPVPARDSLIGLRIGNCVVQKKIGAGGMASVYLAQHVGLNRPVAIKVLSGDLMGSEHNIQRFMREAQTAAALDHPNVVSIYDVGESNGLYYITMQYVEGRALDRILAERGALSLAESVAVVKQVCAALTAAHKINVIHRDIKPANILISRDRTVKVVDFGLARVVDGGHTLSAEGIIVGTPHYMAPEQAQGHKVDNRTDIYSLGATFYHLVTGKRCFDGESPLQIVYKQIHEKPRSPLELNPTLPVSVSHVIMKMMEKNPVERFPSAEDVVFALDAAQEQASASGDPSFGSLAADTDTLLDLSVPAPPMRVPGTSPRQAARTPPEPAPALPNPNTATRKHLLLSAEKEGLDRALGPMAVQQGLITQEQLDELMREQQRLKEAGTPSTVAELLVKRGLLDPQQILRLRQTRGPSTTAQTTLPAGERSAPGQETDLIQGRVIADYRLIRPVSSDDVGVFWEAHSIKYGRSVGLKVARNSDATIAKRLLADAARAKNLSHPNILRVHEAGTETDRRGRLVHYMATDFVEGRTLVECVASRMFPPRRMVQFFEQLADGLQYAHENGVMHPHLKPSAVFVTKDERPLLFFVDLGTRQDESRVYRDRGAVPNAPYMAPEQIPGNTSEADARTDVYRLGAILYEAVAGRPPYSGPPSEVYMKILEGRPTPPRQVNPDIEPGLEAIILRAMDKDRDRRYPSAQDLCAALRKQVKADAERAAMLSASSIRRLPRRARLRHWWQKKGRLAAAVAAVVFLGGPLAYFGTVWYRNSTDRAERERIDQDYDKAMKAAERNLREGQYRNARVEIQLAMANKKTPEAYALQDRISAAITRDDLIESTAALRDAWYAPDEIPSRLTDAVKKALANAAKLPPEVKSDAAFPALEGIALLALKKPLEAEQKFQLSRERRKGDPVDGTVLLNIARINVERWMLARILKAAMADDCEIHDGQAAAWLQHASDALKGEPPQRLSDMDKCVWKMLSALVRGDASGAAREGFIGIRTIGRRRGTEEIDMLIAWSSEGLTKEARTARLTHLSSAIEGRHHYALAHVVRAPLRYADGQPVQALQDLNTALGILKESPALLALRGVVHLDRGDAMLAERDFDEAVRLDPRFTDALNLRARARAELGRHDEALADSDAALALRPVFRGTLTTRARVQAAAGKLAEALATLDQIAERDRDGNVYQLRATVHEKREDWAVAAADYEKALDVAPKDWERRAAVTQALAEARRKANPQ